MPSTSIVRPLIGKTFLLKSYVSMVSSNCLEKKMKVSFVEPSSEDAVSIFEPNEVILRETNEKLGDYLVGYFINENPRFKMVESAAKKEFGANLAWKSYFLILGGILFL
ncbi:hypothetical protein Droror1_Dr00016215 [Drosera rotundifolia]